MATITDLFLSASTDGKGIKIVPTATAGTLLHTSDATAKDEITLWIYNGHTANVDITVEFGGVTVPDNTIVMTIPYKDGMYLVIPGTFLQNSLTVNAFASVANVLTAYGRIRRYS